MAFQGYLLQINGRTLPNRYIKLDSYQSTPNQRQDADSYVDAVGCFTGIFFPTNGARWNLRRSECIWLIKQSSSRTLQVETR